MTYEPPRHILLRRRTEAVTDEEVVYLERALAAQLRDCAAFYGIEPPGVTYVPPDTSLGSEAVGIDLVDDDGKEAAIAHHGWMPGANFAWALVGVKEAPDWTVAASHEALEYTLNLRLDRWVQGPGGLWAYEIADPVQADSYPVAITLFNHMRVVRLSNYVLPAFWGEPNHGGASATVYDYLGKLTSPWTLTPGGYAVVESVAGRARLVQIEDARGTELGASALHGTAPTQPDPGSAQSGALEAPPRTRDRRERATSRSALLLAAS